MAYLTKDCLLCIARQIDDLDTLVAFSQASRQCCKIISRIIAFNESKIETDYYQITVMNGSPDIFLKCYLPEISDPSCHKHIYHGPEIIEITTSGISNLGTAIFTNGFIIRHWSMNKVIKDELKAHPLLTEYIKNNENANE